MSPKIVYFGGEPLGAPTLQALITAGYTPSLVVCNPNRPAGRKHILTPPPVKVMAEKHRLPVWQPEHFKDQDQIVQSIGLLTEADLFIVVAYNKILPQWLIALPPHKTINVHPSLLPKLRGASPIRSAILRNEPAAVGVSIMQMDAAMDHGPIITQEAHPIDASHWPISGTTLDAQLIAHGAELLIRTLPDYLQGTVVPTPQDHAAATYCGKLDKSMAELSIDPYQLPTGATATAAYCTIQAFMGIGNAWFTHQDIRYKITSAHLESERLIIDTVIPAGKTETLFSAVFG